MSVKIRKDLAFRRVAGEMFIVDSAKARLHELNGPAALIWEGLSKGRSEATIVPAIVEEFEVDAKTALADVRSFISELVTAGLVEGEI
ncbi:MAG TPA: hypothetical protein DCS63_07240 [Elusimicrobia bacterium]|nr:hypothetical protein [Elusimicrobiota bacterium]